MKLMYNDSEFSIVVFFPWAVLSKEALTLQPPPKNISSHTEKKSRAKRKRNYSMHYRNRHKIVRRNGEHGQNTQSIIHYAVKDR